MIPNTSSMFPAWNSDFSLSGESRAAIRPSTITETRSQYSASSMKCVVATTVVIVTLFMTLPVFYYVVEMPAFAVCIAAVVYIILAIAMVYYAKERFKEIEEGLDDAADDY